MPAEQDVKALNERIDQLEGEIEGLTQDYSALSEKVEAQAQTILQLTNVVSDGFNRVSARLREL